LSCLFHFNLARQSPMPSDPRPVVTVRAPARLHLGFLDPSGSLGRRWGSLGLVVEDLDTEVVVRPAERDAFVAGASMGGEIERARAHVDTLRELSGRREPLRLELLRVPPAHAGFGSGTQLALAVGSAFMRHHALEASTPELAHWLGRGLRSGVGCAGFDQGGLLVDGGPGEGGRPAPAIARVHLPDDWRIVLALDARARGLSGGDERRALAALPALPRAQAADLCHQVLMRVLPGAATHDFAAFAAGLGAIQRRLGEYFAPAQGGQAWSSAAVGRLMRWIARERGEDAFALGQSSWGPAGFVVAPTQAEAEALVASAQGAGAIDAALELRIVRGRNRGSDIDLH
jgi:beta-RFAP synthase